MRDHQWELRPEYRRFAESFANALMESDYARGHAMFAPYLQVMVSPEQLEQYVEQELREMAEIWELETPLRPQAFTIDWNAAYGIHDLRDSDARQRNEPLIYGLRHPEVTFSHEITEDNFCAWVVIQFLPNENDGVDFNGYFDWWMVIVKDSGEYRVGYFEIHEPD